MNRRLRVIFVFAIAIVMAAAASFGVYRLIQSRPIREVEVAHSFVMVAAKALPMGTRLKAGDVKLVAWPSSSPVPGGFDKVEAVADRGLIAAVVENEPLTNSKLAPKEAGAGLPPSIPPGMRAISVRVNEVIGVAGFVVPGTRVDVLVTMNDDRGGMTRVVVSNVLVLTAGTRYDQEKAKQGDPIPSSVVTLMATPKDAERITLATSQGQLTLTLRNPLDTESDGSTGTRTASLFGGEAPPAAEKPVQRQVVRAAPSAAPEPPPEPKIYTVETIRAAKRTEEVVH